MKKYNLKQRELLRLVTILLFLFAIFGCNNDTIEPEVDKRGDLISSSFLSGYSSDFIQAIVNSFDVTVTVDIKYDVDVFKILYFTPGPDGTLVIASGALMIPKASSEFPLFCFQHGTETKRDLVVSVNPVAIGEGVAGLVSSSIGFVTFIPDYLGLGDSNILHPYLHADLSAGTVIDMLRAGKFFCEENEISLNGDLYIGGYSEGGYVTLATQREIEDQSSFIFDLVASAPQAGPYDLYSTVDYFIAFDEYPEPTFMAYLLTAYNDVYGWNSLDKIFKAPYASKMTSLFDGTKTKLAINSELPNKISELVTDSYIDGFKNGTEKEFVNAIKKNTLLSWTPHTPIRFYHCISDEVVPYQNTLTAIQNFEANGATKIELVTYEGMTHSETSLHAVPQMIEWFDSLRINR